MTRFNILLDSLVEKYILVVYLVCVGVNKRFLYKKGISSVIAVVLLTVFTISIGGIISLWTYDYTKTTTEAASSGTTGTGGVVNCANQIISISDVSVTQNGDTLSEFNDSEILKTYSHIGGGGDVAYLKIPKNATVTTAQFSVTGVPY